MYVYYSLAYKSSYYISCDCDIGRGCSAWMLLIRLADVELSFLRT